MCHLNVQQTHPGRRAFGLPIKIELAGGIGGADQGSRFAAEGSVLLAVPCTTLRTEPEWPKTLTGGMNVLAPIGENLRNHWSWAASYPTSQPFGDGHAPTESSTSRGHQFEMP